MSKKVQGAGGYEDVTEASDAATFRSILTGTATPTVNAAFVGQVFIDTTADDAYIAIDTGSGASDWKQTTP